MSLPVEKEPFAIPGTAQFGWTRPNGRTHRIMLRLPKGKPPAAGYPAIFVLDANSVFGTVAEAVRLQARGPHRLEEAVVVGIGYETDQPFDTERRFYDYAVRADDGELPPRPDGSAWPVSGGADAFLAWLETELVPAIGREVPLDALRLSLVGHSLGGLFALHALFEGRGVFRRFAAGSPSIWWKSRAAFDQARRWLEARGGARPGASSAARGRAAGAPRLEAAEPAAEPGAAGPVRLLLGVGEEEKPHMVADARELYGLLSETALPELRTEFRCYPEEGHLSVLLPFVNHAIRLALKD